MGRVGCGILLFALLFSPATLRAQEPDSATGPGDFLRAFVEMSTRAAAVHGSVKPIIGGAALLQLGETWRVGGAGLFMAGSVDLDDDPVLPLSRLQMGYGGAVLERVLRAPSSDEVSGITSRISVRGRVLLGMGNASARDAVTRVRYLSDNFVVVEPTLILSTPLGSWVEGGALLGYRITLGVEDLGEVDESGLRGLSLGISLQLGPF